MSQDPISDEPTRDDPTVDSIDRELRRARAEEIALEVAEREAMRSKPPTRVDESASPLPYLGATAVASVAIVAGIVFAGLPALETTQIGLTFLVIAMILKRADDIPTDHPSALVRWVGNRVDRLGDKFGVELYGLMALTTFLRAEALSLSSSAVTLAEILASPVAATIQWLVSEFIESMMNAVGAMLWWMPLFGNLGWQLAVAVIAAVWAVLWVLDIPERAEDYGAREVARLGGDVANLGRDLQALGDDVMGMGRDLGSPPPDSEDAAGD